MEMESKTWWWVEKASAVCASCFHFVQKMRESYGTKNELRLRVLNWEITKKTTESMSRTSKVRWYQK
jgi:hypothetical protein